MKTHACAAIGCARQVPNHMLMCAPHWWTLTPALRARVWKWFKAIETARTPDDLHHAQTQHRLATLDAIAATAPPKES